MPNFTRRLLAGLAVLCIGAFCAGVQPAAAQASNPLLMRVGVYGFRGNCVPIDFNHIQIQWNRAEHHYQLTVSGIKRFANMSVYLSHQSYGRRPAYWQTVVVGCWKNFIVIPIPTPYYVTMPLTHFVGTRGVEIMGATGAVRRNVPRS